MENDETIQALIEASAQGDSGSFELLYEHLVSKIYPYIRYRVHEEADAVDLTQDVFIDFYRALPQFTYHSRAQLYAFVFLVAKRKLAQFYKKSSEKGYIDSFDEDFHSDTESTVPPGHTHDIAQALAHLEPTTREIIVLHHMSRYTFGEIALMLKMQESAVRVRHHRALKELRTYLEP